MLKGIFRFLFPENGKKRIIENLKKKFQIIDCSGDEILCYCPKREKSFKLVFLKENKVMLFIDGRIQTISYQNEKDLLEKIQIEFKNTSIFSVRTSSFEEAVEDIKNYRIKLLQTSDYYLEPPKNLQTVIDDINRRGENFFHSKLGGFCKGENRK